MKGYLAASKKLFKSTTPVRDIDVVLDNIGSQSSNHQIQKVVSGTHLERMQLVTNTLQYASILIDMKGPKIKKDDLSSVAILKRKNKIVRRLLAKLQEEMPIVIGDFRKFRELHDVRKDCKKLRYTLEIIPVERETKLLELMKQWQTLLGNVRDIEVTEKFAEEKGLLEDLEGALTSMRISRDRMFGSFSGASTLEEYTRPIELI